MKIADILQEIRITDGDADPDREIRLIDGEKYSPEFYEAVRLYVGGSFHPAAMRQITAAFDAEMPVFDEPCVVYRGQYAPSWKSMQGGDLRTAATAEFPHYLSTSLDEGIAARHMLGDTGYSFSAGGAVHEFTDPGVYAMLTIRTKPGARGIDMTEFGEEVDEYAEGEIILNRNSQFRVAARERTDSPWIDEALLNRFDADRPGNDEKIRRIKQAQEHWDIWLQQI